MYRILWILICLAGCTPMSRHVIVYPSDSTYFDANRHYNNKQFDAAAALYARYLEEKPRSTYAIPARLNMGMSYYYLKEWSPAYATLKDIRIDDANLKQFVDGVLAECNAASGGTLSTPAPDATTSASAAPTIRISITDAYLNNTGALVLTGMTNRKATVFIDNKKIELQPDNTFTSTTFWRRGRPVDIAAIGEDKSEGTLSYYPDAEPPREPRNPRSRNISSNSAEIEWDENPEDDIAGYKIYYGLKGSFRQEVNTIIQRTNYEVVGLSNLVQGANRTIQFSVKAVDKMGNESTESDKLEIILP